MVLSVIGFDSAWTDKASAPGAICAASLDDRGLIHFDPPELATFSAALQFIDRVKSRSTVTIIALDQPTIVPNATSLRPVERVASSLISWLGGGVQPSNTGKKGMFCSASPIWPFLHQVGAEEDPEAGRLATEGLHLIEVFPALALPSIDPEFYGRLAAPRYNPARRKTFKPADWHRVAEATAKAFDRLGLGLLAQWCRCEARKEAPKKADQDRLDSMLCLAIGLMWRLCRRDEMMLIGDLHSGYMVAPASGDVRARLMARARDCGVPAA